MNPRRKERKESLGPYDREQPQQRYAFPTQSSQPYPNHTANTNITGNSPHSVNFPRATSPSGFTGLFTKPAKWFSRSREPHVSTSSNNTEPRSSTSSVQPQRRPLISQPTDPRPLLPSLQSEPYMQSPRVGSRLVCYLSRLLPSLLISFSFQVGVRPVSSEDAYGYRPASPVPLAIS